jgi:hypothetical protein
MTTTGKKVATVLSKIVFKSHYNETIDRTIRARSKYSTEKLNLKIIKAEQLINPVSGTRILNLSYS